MSMDEKITSFHIRVRQYDESHQNINLNSIDPEAMGTTPYPSKEDVMIAAKMVTNPENLLFQSDMNPGGEAVVQHIITHLNSQSDTVAGGSYKSYFGDFVNSLADDSTSVTKISSLVFHNDESTKVKMFIKAFNEAIENQSKQPFPTSLFTFKTQYVEIEGQNEATVIGTFKSREEMVRKYSNTLLPAKILFTIGQSQFEIIFPWVSVKGGIKLHISGKTPDIFKKLFTQLKGTAVCFNFANELRNLNEFLSAHYIFCNRNYPLSIRGVDISLLLMLSGISNVPYSVGALAYHFTATNLMESYIQKGNVDYDRNSEMYLQHEQKTGIILWKISVICQILFTVNLAPTPGMGVLITKRNPVKFLNWADLLFQSLVDGAVLPCEADYIKDPRMLISLLTYSKKTCWKSDLVLLLIPQWRSITGGGALTDRQCLQFISRFVPVLTSGLLPKNLRVAPPSDIGAILGYTFDDTIVLSPGNYTNIGINYDHMCNVIPNADKFEHQITQLVKNGEMELLAKDIINKLRQAMFETEIIIGLSPSDVFIMLCWRHMRLAEYLFKFFHQELDSDEFLFGSNFLYSTAKFVKKPPKVVMWEEKNLESVRVVQILKYQKIINNPSSNALSKRKARRELVRTCSKIGIPVERATRYVWKKLKDCDAKNNSRDAKAEDNLPFDMELDLCGFTTEGEIVVAMDIEDEDDTEIDHSSSNVTGNPSSVEGTVYDDTGNYPTVMNTIDDAPSDEQKDILDFYKADPIDNPLLDYE